MMEVVVTTGALCKTCKAPVKSSPPTNQQPFLQAECPSCRPNQQCQSTEGESITLHGLAHPKLTWRSAIFVLTSKGSWLSWGGLPSF